jgi:outer membrane lipoprotein-sorting protein
MRRLRTIPIRRLYAIVAAVAALAITGGLAQAALSGSNETPAPKPLDRAIYDAAHGPAVAGVTARIKFTNDLLPAGSLPNGAASPLVAGAEGRLWLTGDGRFRFELQSDAGDAQVTYDGERISVYDPTSNTVYRGALARDESERRHRGEQPTMSAIRRGLDRLAQMWTLSGARPTSTADRPSYTLRIAPRDDGGLLGAAELAWDAANGVPLRAALYAQGQSDPVLELEATEISFERVPESAVSAEPPAGARVVEIDPAVARAEVHSTRVRGVEAVQRRLDFPLASPDELAGLPRKDVGLIRTGDSLGAISTYGEGMGAIVVIQQKAAEGDENDLGAQLPQVNIDGATGSELATALGTIVMFERDGVSYTVAGSVPPVAAENAARGLR